MKTYHSWRDKTEGKNFTKLQMENCRYTKVNSFIDISIQYIQLISQVLNLVFPL